MSELVLFIGNGINRLSKSGPSWSQLLKNIQNDLGNNIDLDNDYKPFPMAFEEIIMTNFNDNYTERLKKIKKSISKELIRMESNDWHKRIMESIKVKHILTTNYDYCFEKVLSPDFSNTIESGIKKYKTKEIRYSLRRKNEILDKSVWHIHGELYDPKNYKDDKRNFKESSILIGYEHYSESLKIMQDYKNGRNKWARTPLKQKLSEISDLGSCWMDYLFTSKVIILGLDLSFSEIDLWWLLNYRARFLKQYSTKSKRPSQAKNNELIFCHPIFKANSIKNMSSTIIETERIKREMQKIKARAEILKAFEVTIEEIQCNNYEDFYTKSLDKFKI